MKTFSERLSYDAPADRVLKMLLDPAFREEVCRAQKQQRWDVSITPGEAGTEVRIVGVHTATGLPSYAAKLVGSSVEVIGEETWQDRGATFTLTIPGKPGTMTGTVALTEQGEQTVLDYDVQVEARIPLVGGKIEGVISSLVLGALRAEHQVGQEWLASS